MIPGDTDPEPVSPAQSSPPAAIEYDRSGVYMTRRQGRVLMALTLLNLALLAWFVFAPDAGRQIQQRWQQWKAQRAERAKVRQVMADQQPCLDYSAPAGRVIYEEDPRLSLALCADAAAYVPVRTQLDNLLATTVAWPAPARRADQPAPWTTWVAGAVPGYISNNLGCASELPIVFLGGRTNPVTNEQFLVVVQFDARPSFNALDPGVERARLSAQRRLYASLFTVGNGTVRPVRKTTDTIHLLLPPTHARLNDSRDAWTVTQPAFLTVSMGSPDPVDTSRFTIPYRVNGVPGVIDGTVQNRLLHLRPRDAALVNFGGSDRAWSLPMPPSDATTRPATQSSTQP